MASGKLSWWEQSTAQDLTPGPLKITDLLWRKERVPQFPRGKGVRRSLMHFLFCPQLFAPVGVSPSGPRPSPPSRPPEAPHGPQNEPQLLHLAGQALPQGAHAHLHPCCQNPGPHRARSLSHPLAEPLLTPCSQPSLPCLFFENPLRGPPTSPGYYKASASISSYPFVQTFVTPDFLWSLLIYSPLMDLKGSDLF